jgi:hypothetical protein
LVADVEFFFDPVCPFCWQTSQWVRQVSRLRDLDVRWRFISLRFLNEPLGYDDKPANYPQAHAQGTRLLRVAAAVRQDHGDAAVGRLYAAMGRTIWESDPPGDGSFDAILARQAEGVDIPAILASVGLPVELAGHADSEAFDPLIRAETAEALERAGDDVGTPIISLSPPDGPAFFGPVISELPSDEEAVELWDAMVTLSRWPGFAELKRSLRTMPDIRIMGALRDRSTTAA